MDFNDLTMGQMKALVSRLGGMEAVHAVLQGRARLEIIQHLIDLAADAKLPKEWSAANGWKIEEHRRGSATYEWNPDKLKLYLSDRQKNGCIIGNDLREEIKTHPVMNANMLDYLLEHPELIPEDWKGKAVLFWGTVYRDPDGNLFVRCLHWDGGRRRWGWDYVWLDFYFYVSSPAVVSASS